MKSDLLRREGDETRGNKKMKQKKGVRIATEENSFNEVRSPNELGKLVGWIIKCVITGLMVITCFSNGAE